jgi:hypothetical protein
LRQEQERGGQQSSLADSCKIGRTRKFSSLTHRFGLGVITGEV